MGGKIPVIALNAVVSIVAIISIYREGGILKRLRATPLRPQTILGAHVIVKLLLTTVTLGAMALAGRRLYPASIDLPMLSFVFALLFTTAITASVQAQTSFSIDWNGPTVGIGDCSGVAPITSAIARSSL